MLAHVKVAAIDALLGLFDQPAKQVVFDGVAVVDIQALDQVVHLAAAKQAHQLILEGEVEARGAWITLAGGAAAQLVVNAAGFMSFGTDHVQAAQRAHALHVFHIFQEGNNRFLVDAIFLARHGQQGLAALLVGHIVGIIFRAVQHADHAGQHILGEFAAQLDVDAAAGHIGGDGDHAEGTGAGNDLAFFVMLARVQHLVRDAALDGF